MTDLYKLRLREAAERIRCGRITSTDYTKSLLARIVALEKNVQAWQWLSLDRAMTLAEKAGQADGPMRVAHPLHGISIAVKDNFYTAGIPTGMGCRAHTRDIPDETAHAAKHLQAAGPRTRGKTPTAEADLKAPPKTR